MARHLLFRASAIIAISVIAGAVHSLTYNSGPKPIKLQMDEPLALPSPTPTQNPGITPAAQQPTTPPPAPVKVNINITIEEAKALFDQQTAFVDARSLDDYEAGHVLNAFQLTPEAADAPDGRDVLDFLDREKPLVVYCSGGQCDASKNLVLRLQLQGFKYARIMEDGYPAWQQAGHPTGTGKPVVGGSH